MKKTLLLDNGGKFESFQLGKFYGLFDGEWLPLPLVEQLPANVE